MNLLVLTKEDHIPAVKIITQYAQREGIDTKPYLVFDRNTALAGTSSGFYDVLFITMRQMPVNSIDFVLDSESAGLVLKSASLRGMGLLLAPELREVVMADEGLKRYDKKRFVYSSPHELMRQLMEISPRKCDSLTGRGFGSC